MASRSLLSCLLTCAAVLQTPAVLAQEATAAVRYDVPAINLKDALVAFATQTGISISFNEATLDGYKSGYVFGARTPAGALAIILERSPYTFAFTGEETVQLVPRAEGAAAHTEPSLLSLSSRPDLMLVTATKRNAYAQKLPLSISAVDGHTLERWGIRDFNALAPRLAGISFTNLGPSRNKIFFRGISDGSFADRTQSTIGVYLDETRIIFNDTNPDIRLIDLERIEAVRGPQGSLYGGGSVGGVFRMVTAKPDLNEYSGSARAAGSATQDGSANGKFDAAINLPLAKDKFGVRLAGYYEHAGGYIDDAGIGENDINSSEIGGARLMTRAQIADQWTLDATAQFQIVNLDNTQYVFEAAGGLNRSTSRREPHRDEFQLYSATLKGDFAGVRLTSSSAFVRRNIDSIFDATAALPAITGIAGAEGVYEVANDIETFTHETRIVSDDGGRFDWLIGGFYALRNEALVTNLTVDNQTPPAMPFFSDRDDEITETALFGEFTYGLTDKLRFTAGARLSRTELDVNVVSGGPANMGAAMLSETRSRETIAPKAALSYQHSDDLLLYAQAAQASRIGGINVNTPLDAITLLNPGDDTTRFESDTLWNLELGLKSSWLGGDITFNAAGFYLFWNEIQTDQILPSGFSFVTNAGRARNFGFEVELSGRPTSKLELNAAFFWNNPSLTEANPFLGAEIGDKLPNIASVSASAGIAYEFSLPHQWTGAVSADYSYVGESALTFAEDLAPTMGNYHLGNVGLTARKDSMRIGIYVDNVWNERGNTFAFGNPFSLSTEMQETPLRPRTVGVFVEKRF